MKEKRWQWQRQMLLASFAKEDNDKGSDYASSAKRQQR
jgi:hypothetical protein